MNAKQLVLILAAGALFVPTTASAATGGIDLQRECVRYASQGVNVKECVRQAQIARDATAKYRDFTVALADGYVPDPECRYSSAGAMGQHWLRLDRDGVFAPLDPATPAEVLYIPIATGLQLVAVEYVETALVGGLPYYGSDPPDPGNVTPAPEMFGGRRFDGPMAGHVPGQPWHYDLHVWLWARNPAGLFAQYNPSLSC